MGHTLPNTATTGTIWSAIDKFGIVIMQFIINLVLARLLAPDDFGLVGMILIIVIISNTLTDGGFGAALIQKSKPNEADFSTAFYINIATALLLYIIIYFTAPIVATFLGATELVDILRVLSLVFVINSFGLVPKVKLRRLIAFKQIAISNIIAYILASATAIFLAQNGFGAWGLVAMHIVNSLLSNIFISIAAHWHPSFTFSTKSLKELFAYGEYMLISDILANVCFNIQNTLIGKYFSPYTAGQYAQAKKMEEVACTTLPIAMSQVLFPVFSSLQHNKEAIIEKLRLSIKMISFIIFPLMALLIVIAKPLILFMFGAKWIDSVIYFQVLCIGGFLYPMQSFNYHAVAAVGKSKELFYVGVFKSFFLIASLLISVHINMNAVLIAMVLSNVVNCLANSIITERYIGYKVTRQFLDVLPLLVLSLIIGSALYFTQFLCNIHWILLVVIYIISYITINYITKSDILLMAFEYVQKLKHTNPSNVR